MDSRNFLDLLVNIDYPESSIHFHHTSSCNILHFSSIALSHSFHRILNWKSKVENKNYHLLFKKNFIKMRNAQMKMVSTFASFKTKPRMKSAILPDFLSLFTCKAFRGIFFTAVNLNEHKIDISKNIIFIQL